MKAFLENWHLAVVFLCIFGAAGAAAVRFYKQPKEEQQTKVKEWLLWAVTTAEADLGSGTGKLKLRQVYDMFLERFPKVAAAVSFETFSKWVDTALIDMRKMLEQNQAVSRLVKGGE